MPLRRGCAAAAGVRRRGPGPEGQRHLHTGVGHGTAGPSRGRPFVRAGMVEPVAQLPPGVTATVALVKVSPFVSPSMPVSASAEIVLS